MMNKIECEDRDQHQESTKLREQKKLQRRIKASLMTPDDDQEKHRDQHQLPGKVKQEQVDRQEHAHDPRQNPHKVEMEKADFVPDFRPGGEHRHDAQEKRQHQHQQAKAIERKMKM